MSSELRTCVTPDYSMGQGGSRRTDIRRAIRDNEPSLTTVQLDGTRLTEKDVRKLSEALRQNR